MTYSYVKHDGCVLRSQADRPPMAIELYVPETGWKAFPEPADGEIGSSSTAAWFEGTPLTDSEASELIGQNEQNT